MKHFFHTLLALAGSAVGACAIAPAESSVELSRPQLAAAAEVEPVVGSMRVLLSTNDGKRKLPVQLWYPTSEQQREEAVAGYPVSEFEPPGERRALLERLIAKAPEGCTTRVMHAALDAPLAAASEPYPLLVYSHHLEGMRIALFSLAEALARRGFIVAAPDHEGRTLFDRTDDLQSPDLLGQVLRVRSDDLSVRVSDLKGLLDILLDPQSQQVPDAIRGHIDPKRVGLFGHSMGSVTTGAVVASEPRVRAAAYLAFPPAQVSALLDLFGQPTLDKLRVPGLFMLNKEDAALGAVSGLDAAREQFKAYASSAYLVEVEDTGHWSFADDCGLNPDFQDGCGRGTRQELPYAPFEFLDNTIARQTAAQYLSEFFAEQLLGDMWNAQALPHTQITQHPPMK